MATLTVGQVLALGRKHGFTDAELPDLYAVTTTEAGNRTDAKQLGGLGRGLVQIDLGWHGPPRGTVTEAQAYDPDFAMAFARKLYLERRWAPWYGPKDNPRGAETARQEARKALAAGSDKDPSALEAFGDALTKNPLGWAIGKGAENLADAGKTVGGAAGGIVADQLAGAIRSLVPASLVRRLLLVFGGAGLIVVGATALGADAIKGPNPVRAAAKIAKGAAR